MFGKKSGKNNPSVTIWVRESNPDDIVLTTLLIRLNNETPEQLPQAVRDMMDKKTSYRNIRFEKRPNPTKGGTNVTCIFEQ